MKILILFSLLITSLSVAQISNNHLTELKTHLKKQGKSDDAIKEVLSGVVKNPEIYNNVWKKVVDEALKSDSSKWKYLDDLNLKFKTFQTKQNSKTSLGLCYDFNFDWANFRDNNNQRMAQNFGLTAKGNIAFDKLVNPNDFLETNLNYSYSWFFGGVIKNSDSEVFTILNKIEDKLVTYDNPNSDEAMNLWNKFGQNLKLSNQYFISVNPKVGLESNQDFSKTQIVPGLQLNLGAKAWSNSTALSYLNVFDYPFALIRLISGTDKDFTPYGSTIPTVQFGLDYVIPENDTVRNNLVDNDAPYLRTKLEASFRTYVSKIKNQRIFFNANFRYYQELSPEEAIKDSNLDNHTYFVMALQSSSGFYVSYAYGKLPFDSKDDEVYSIGFNYTF